LTSSTSERATNVATFLNEKNGHLDIGESESLEGARFETFVWPLESVTFIPCADSERGTTGIAINIDASWTSNEDLSDALRPVIEPYVEARLTEIDPEECTPPA
jgi:hypothetical protein